MEFDPDNTFGRRLEDDVVLPLFVYRSAVRSLRLSGGHTEPSEVERAAFKVAYDEKNFALKSLRLRYDEQTQKPVEVESVMLVQEAIRIRDELRQTLEEAGQPTDPLHYLSSLPLLAAMMAPENEPAS